MTSPSAKQIAREFQERKRLGCDGCKQDVNTFRLDNFGDPLIRIWLCSGCLKQLQAWHSEQ